jgi:PII-like signaling protein
VLEAFNLTKGLQLVIYLNQSDTIRKRPAAEAIVKKAMELSFMGASVFRAVEGYGSSHRIEIGHLLSLEDDRGEMIVLVDGEQSKTNEFLTWLRDELPGTFLTISEIHHTRLS